MSSSKRTELGDKHSYRSLASTKISPTLHDEWTAKVALFRTEKGWKHFITSKRIIHTASGVSYWRYSANVIENDSTFTSIVVNLFRNGGRILWKNQRRIVCTETCCYFYFANAINWNFARGRRVSKGHTAHAHTHTVTQAIDLAHKCYFLFGFSKFFHCVSTRVYGLSSAAPHIWIKYWSACSGSHEM